ncbi:MAG: hypothetical protein RLY70_4161 [Planctomycetota bacterium]
MVAHSTTGSTSSHGNPQDHGASDHDHKSDHGSDHDSHDHGAGDHHGDASAPDAVFRSAFDSEDQKQLLEEDSEAWYNVTGELLTIVAVGVAFFIFIVVLISR